MNHHVLSPRVLRLRLLFAVIGSSQLREQTIYQPAATCTEGQSVSA